MSHQSIAPAHVRLVTCGCIGACSRARVRTSTPRTCSSSTWSRGSHVVALAHQQLHQLHQLAASATSPSSRTAPAAWSPHTSCAASWLKQRTTLSPLLHIPVSLCPTCLTRDRRHVCLIYFYCVHVLYFCSPGETVPTAVPRSRPSDCLFGCVLFAPRPQWRHSLVALLPSVPSYSLSQQSIYSRGNLKLMFNF